MPGSNPALDPPASAKLSPFAAAHVKDEAAVASIAQILGYHPVAKRGTR